MFLVGMEAAAFCVGKAKTVTVIGRDTVPFKKVFGEAIGQRLLSLFQVILLKSGLR